MPKRATKGSVARPVEPLAFMFHDDGAVPNNAQLPMLYYRGCFDLAGAASPERVIETLFAKNGWGEMWRDGIFPYVHYHSQIHEGLALRAAAPRCGSAAERVRNSTSRRATSCCCRPAPAINACGRAPTSW
jgi:hypothetical protein